MHHHHVNQGTSNLIIEVRYAFVPNDIPGTSLIKFFMSVFCNIISDNPKKPPLFAK